MAIISSYLNTDDPFKILSTPSRDCQTLDLHAVKIIITHHCCTRLDKPIIAESAIIFPDLPFETFAGDPFSDSFPAPNIIYQAI